MGSACSPTAPPFHPHELVALIDQDHPVLSVSRQAELLGVNRQAYYYHPTVNQAEQALLKAHMDAVDAIYTAHPYYGSRRLQIELRDNHEIDIGRARIRTVMNLLGLEAIYPKPNTSKTGVGTEHSVYPYLLRGVTASYPNHIWGTDITYIKTQDGFVYLVAFIDWYSRYVISWALSDTLEQAFVLAALREALCFVSDCGLQLPDISNSDKGSHFTSEAYTGILEKAGVAISMDGRGRCLDNIFTERLWRTVKYEDVFLKSYQNLEEARLGLTEYFYFYNNKRKHQSLDYRTPTQVYFDVRID